MGKYETVILEKKKLKLILRDNVRCLKEVHFSLTQIYYTNKSKWT